MSNIAELNYFNSRNSLEMCSLLESLLRSPRLLSDIAKNVSNCFDLLSFFASKSACFFSEF